MKKDYGSIWKMKMSTEMYLNSLNYNLSLKNITKIRNWQKKIYQNISKAIIPLPLENDIFDWELLKIKLSFMSYSHTFVHMSYLTTKYSLVLLSKVFLPPLSRYNIFTLRFVKGCQLLTWLSFKQGIL